MREGAYPPNSRRSSGRQRWCGAPRCRRQVSLHAGTNPAGMTDLCKGHGLALIRHFGSILIGYLEVWRGPAYF